MGRWASLDGGASTRAGAECAGGNTQTAAIDGFKAGLKPIVEARAIKGFIGNPTSSAKLLAGKRWSQFGKAYQAFKTFQAEGGLRGRLGPAGQALG